MNELELRDLRQDVNTGSSLDQYRVLELNSDFTPITFHPLSTVHWQKAIRWYMEGIITNRHKFHIVEFYDDVFVHHGSKRKAIKLPSVIAHTSYQKPPNIVKLSKLNMFIRDDYKCQYTGEQCTPSNLSWDHVVPISRGGTTKWDNLVLARRDINHLKSNLTAKEFKKKYGFKLHKVPYEPTVFELLNKAKKYIPSTYPPCWSPYIPQMENA